MMHVADVKGFVTSTRERKEKQVKKRNIDKAIMLHQLASGNVVFYA